MHGAKSRLHDSISMQHMISTPSPSPSLFLDFEDAEKRQGRSTHKTGAFGIWVGRLNVDPWSLIGSQEYDYNKSTSIRYLAGLDTPAQKRERRCIVDIVCLILMDR
eukprot:scpid101815/ scgid20569/ 